MRRGNSINRTLNDFHAGKDCKAYDFFGCHPVSDGKFTFRVWAPRAFKVFVTGTFSNWNEIEMSELADNECFEITVAAEEGDKYRYIIETSDGRRISKADPYAFLFSLPPDWASVVYVQPQMLKNDSLFLPLKYDEPVNIYEVNLLSWKRHKDGSYYTYKELSKELVPYVRDMGYTHVEFMPVNEFPFDGSWGYQVTGYFSVTSRMGTPEDFSALVDDFHKNNISVIVDWVPAHFPKDDWGLYEFDGAPLYECPLWDRMEHSGWGTRKFDFGRGEVDSFLLSSAHFLFDVYGIDGLRVDAVASMLYLNYDRADDDFTPNENGGNTNTEAIAFIKKLNSSLKKSYPGAIIIAEESTAFPKITEKTENGGLGFDYKWNMGWMNDVLFYCRQDPYFRNHHHEKLTFSMVYSFGEKYVLPLSHDEVVHVKGSIVNKMPGEYADKFAGERALLGFMYAHPGKKLNFMGYEFSQFKEWDYRTGLEFFLKDFEFHNKMSVFVKELNFFYRANAPLYEIENDWTGFKWLIVDDKYHNVIAFSRQSLSGENIVVVINFSGIDLPDYKIPVEQGKYRVILNTDDKKFGGRGVLRKKSYIIGNQTGKSEENLLNIYLPKLTCLYINKEILLGDFKQC